MSKKKKGLVIGLAVAILVVLVSSVVAIDVEWECYEEFAADWGAEKIYSSTYPNVPLYTQCYPMDRNIGLPYSELTEYICICEQRREDDSRFKTTRIIWALDDNNIKHCQCEPASSPSQNVEKDESDNKEKEEQEEETTDMDTVHFTPEEGTAIWNRIMLPGFNAILAILGMLFVIGIKKMRKK